MKWLKKVILFVRFLCTKFVTVAQLVRSKFGLRVHLGVRAQTNEINSIKMRNCVYILYCNDNRYYIGSTINLNKRLKEHNQGKVVATKNRRPIKLAFAQDYDNKNEAHRIELWIKKQKSKKLINRIIEENIIKKML